MLPIIYLTIVALVLFLLDSISRGWIAVDTKKFCEHVVKLWEIDFKLSEEFAQIINKLEQMGRPEEIEVFCCASVPAKNSTIEKEDEKKGETKVPKPLITSVQFWNLPAQERFAILKAMKENEDLFLPVFTKFFQEFRNQIITFYQTNNI